MFTNNYIKFYISSYVSHFSILYIMSRASDTLYLLATVSYKSYHVTPSRNRICKPLIQNNYLSLVKKCTQNVMTRKALVKTVRHMLTIEVAAMCSCNLIKSRRV